MILSSVMCFLNPKLYSFSSIYLTFLYFMINSFLPGVVPQPLIVWLDCFYFYLFALFCSIFVILVMIHMIQLYTKYQHARLLYIFDIVFVSRSNTKGQVSSIKKPYVSDFKFHFIYQFLF